MNDVLVWFGFLFFLSKRWGAEEGNKSEGYTSQQSLILC